MPRSGEALRTTKDTIPASTALTPTVTTVGTYFSISVADASVQAGAVFYIPAQSATRKIKSMNVPIGGASPTEGQLETAFGSDVTADATVAIIPQQDAKLLKWSASPVSAGSLIVNGVTYNADLSDNREAAAEALVAGTGFISVPVLDATTHTATITWTLF
tara:strand:+ start:6580 stop:7062 length:483 start_codon:yes stop_codon:yes gene_type:complete